MEAKITPGAAQDVEKWSKNFSGRPPAGTSEFCCAPDASKSAPGPISIASWSWAPGGLRELILIILGCILAPCWDLLLIIWGAVLGSVVGPPGEEKQQLKQQKQQRKQQKQPTKQLLKIKNQP